MNDSIDPNTGIKISMARIALRIAKRAYIPLISFFLISSTRSRKLIAYVKYLMNRAA